MTAFDTHSSVKTLTAAGMPEPQAEAVTALLHQSRETDQGSLVTKSDLAVNRADLLREIAIVRTELGETKADLTREIAIVRTELGETRADLTREIASVRTELGETRAEVMRDVAEVRSDLAQTRADLRRDLAETKADILKWMIGIVGGAVIINAATVIGAMLALVRLVGR